MPISPADQSSYQDALQQLYDTLNQAYWVATTIDAKDAINGAAQAVSDILTTLNQGALDSNTAQYTTLKSTVTAVNNKLITIKSQVNNWIHAISVAGQVAGAIDQALNLAAKVFSV
jgi:hypothetical protein